MKKYLFVLAALVMATGIYSFTTSQENVPAPTVQNWYDFVGDDPNDPMDYQLRSGTPPTCNSGSKRCAVQAEQDTDLSGNFPDLQDPSISIRNKP